MKPATNSVGYIPLAQRMRPKTPDRLYGQSHLTGPGKPLSAYLDGGCNTSAIFYGPPGTGKTSAAMLIAEVMKKPFIQLNATTDGTTEVKQAFSIAEKSENGILLYLDEIQYFNKKQQQTMLSYVESGKVQLIAATTENPYFYVYKALLSRCLILEFKSLSTEDVKQGVMDAITDINQNWTILHGNLKPEEGLDGDIAELAAGDLRKALTMLEMLCLSTQPDLNGIKHLTRSGLQNIGASAALRFDRGGDEMYDLASGLHKSLRGSDPDAACHYLARFLEAGDLVTPIRRILCAASEDVGLAWNDCALIAKALCDSALQLGLPEAKIPLGHAVCLICNAPKSNSAHDAIDAAWEDVKHGAVYPLPRNLQNVHADTTGIAPCHPKQAQNYLYPHSYPNHWVDQPYMPEPLVGKRYYMPGDNPAEQNAKRYWDAVKHRT